MSLIGRIAKRVRAGAARSRLEREMQEEMAAHVEQAAERYRARGMSDQDALLAARREFGNVGVLQEEARDARGARWIESALGDMRHALRQYGRTPLLAGTIVLTLTLGIGVSSAAFSVVAGVLTRPAPGVPDDAALVTIRGIQVEDGRRSGRAVSYPELIEYSRVSSFTEIAGVAGSLGVIEVESQPAGTAAVQFVTPNYFRALGVPLSAGTGFAQSKVDDHKVPEMTAVIARLYAAQQFGVAENAVGKTIRVNGLPVRINGVAGPRFVDPFGKSEHRTIWMPVSAWPLIDPRGGAVFLDPTEGQFQIVGRLRDGQSPERATPAVQLVAARARMSSRSAADSRGRGPVLDADVVRLRGDTRVKSASGRNELYIAVAGITACVLLILLVCTTTVSSLLVGAAVSRRHEIAVRLALGASRGRIVRQLLTENVLLAAVAGAAGLVVFAAISRGLHDSITDLDFDPTWGTALATAGFALATAFLCGLSPALHATREGLAGVLKDSSTNSTVKSRLQRVFVVTQIALTQPLLLGLAVAIAVVMREGGHTPAQRIGEHVVRARFDVWSAAARSGDRLPAVMHRIASMPGVVSVLSSASGFRRFKIEVPAQGRQASARTEQIASGYFKAMDIHLVRGREFIDADTVPRISPVIVGSDFAKAAFGDADPIGRRLATYGSSGQPVGSVEVVGVVSASDIGESEYGEGIRIFSPNGGPLAAPMANNAILIRTAGLAEPLIGTFREIARVEAPLMPLTDMETLAQVERDTRSEIVEAASAAAVGGGITLFLASIGLYAVVALGVGQRRREIGVRISLGARPSQVVALFFRGGLRVSLLGLAIGLPLSAAFLALAGSQVGIPRANLPVIAALVAITVVVVASLATWIPARRAAGVDPLIALRDG